MTELLIIVGVLLVMWLSARFYPEPPRSQYQEILDAMRLHLEAFTAELRRRLAVPIEEAVGAVREFADQVGVTTADIHRLTYGRLAVAEPRDGHPGPGGLIQIPTLSSTRPPRR